MTDEQSWFAKHCSAIYISLLVLVGVACAAGGVEIELSFHDRPYLIFFGKLLVELSIALIIGAIAAIFLSFREVREQLGATIGTLFSEGKIVKLLSPETKNILSKELIYDRVASEASNIEEDLFKQIMGVSEQLLVMEHFHNYAAQIRLSEHPSNRDLVCAEVIRNFRVKVSHLHTPRIIGFKFVYAVNIPDSLRSIKYEDFMKYFKATFGGDSFSDKDTSFHKIDDLADRKRVLGFKFEPTISNVRDDMDVVLHYTVAIPRHENSTATIARYPTRGLQVSITYNKNFEYDCVWFKSQNPKYEDFPGAPGEVQHPEEGILVRTNGWILPGEGVAISWKPKEETRLTT